MTHLKRNFSNLGKKEYDLIIIGGGIFGACAAWDATQRGLSVALLEKKDFSHATSANHFKMVHGGIRYLQHGDIYRIRESSQERSALLRIAPHLVKPLPILIPTYGHGLKGKEILGIGISLYDFLTLDRNWGLQKERKIPRGKFISRKKVLKEFPNLKKEGLTGAAIFCDGQVYNPPRLVLSFLRSAVEKGLDLANYTEVTDFIQIEGRVVGLRVQDVLSGQSLDVRGKVILNTAGPWAHRLLSSKLGIQLESKPTFSRDLAFVVKDKMHSPFGLACSTPTEDSDTIIDRGGRHLFLMPWRDYTLVGVWHKIFQGSSEQIKVTPEELHDFINEINIPKNLIRNICFMLSCSKVIHNINLVDRLRNKFLI